MPSIVCLNPCERSASHAVCPMCSGNTAVGSGHPTLGVCGVEGDGGGGGGGGGSDLHSLRSAFEEMMVV